MVLPTRAGGRLLALVAFAAIAGPWYLVGRQIADAKPVARVALAATGIVWGDRVFSSRQPLAAWLHRRGASYRVWGSRHPAASRVLAAR